MKYVIGAVRLFTGLFLFAAGVVMTINANLGLSPWDVFHQGVSMRTGITIGQTSIIVGVILVSLNCLLSERIGWGTLANMVFIGVFIDFLMINKLIPVFNHFMPKLLMLLAGMFIIGIASFFYLGVGLGSGPRDGLMIALTKKTGKPVRVVRSAIESGVLLIGYFLGGSVGIGTLIAALAIGYFVQLAFKVFHFNVSTVKHRFIDEDIRWVVGKFVKKEEVKIDNAKCDEV